MSFPSLSPALSLEYGEIHFAPPPSGADLSSGVHFPSLLGRLGGERKREVGTKLL